MDTLTPEEQQIILQIPELDLVDLAAELGIAVPEVIDRSSLVLRILKCLLELAEREGLPFSAYDREDLEALPKAHLQALATRCGVPGTPDGMLRMGAKVYKVYNKRGFSSQVPLLLPVLLTPLSRLAHQNS